MITRSKVALLVPALLAMSVSTFSFADNNKHDEQGKGKNHQQHASQQHNTVKQHSNVYVSEKHSGHKATQVKHKPRPHQDWKRGGYLPRDYRGQGYYVHNWKAAHLKEPARGQRWVSVNGDYILVSIATNVILDILTGR